MKVFVINGVYEEKSTGRTCKEVERELLKQGHEIITAFAQGKKSTEHSYKINTKVEYYFHNLFSRIIGLQGYCSFFATKRLIKKIKEFNPDIIHLRNIHGSYINLPLLFKFLNNNDIPVIQSLHDCWAFTGKCPYYTFLKCEKWMTGCEKCKDLKNYPKSYLFDFTKKMYNDKKKWYLGIKDLTIVGVSNWVKTESEKSFLNNGKTKFKHIYNWIDLNTFKKYEDETIKEKYNIDKSKFTIIGVSARWIKGTVRYEDFMKLADSINGEKMQIVMVGTSNSKMVHKNIIHIPFVENTVELAQLYSSADIYIHMSMEDTFGKVIAEALACEVPVIVYKTTGCTEVVGENCGYVVEPRNIDEIVKLINKVYNKEVEFNNMRNWVNTKFNYEKNVCEFVDLYKSIIKNKNLK